MRIILTISLIPLLFEETDGAALNEIARTKRRAVKIGEEIKECYAAIKDLVMPEHCRWFMGPSVTSQNGENQSLRFCQRKSYIRHLGGSRFFSGKEIPLSGECAPFLSHYAGLDFFSSLRNEIWGIIPNTRNPPIKGHALGLMLERIEYLHQAGYAHGDIQLSDFGSEQGLPVVKDRLQNDSIKLGNLLNVRSIYDEEGNYNIRGVIEMKNDLLNFAKKIVFFLYPNSRLFWKFLESVEAIKINSFAFDYTSWIRLFNRMQFYTDMDADVGSHGEDTDASFDTGFLIEWDNVEAQCRGTYNPADSAVCSPIDPSRGIEVEMLGNLIKGHCDNGDEVFKKPTESRQMYKVAHLGNYCKERSLLYLLEEVGRFVPLTYKITNPKLPQGCDTLIEVPESSVNMQVLLSQSNLSGLYMALMNAVTGLKELHNRGVILGGINSIKSINISRDFSIKFVDFEKANSFIDIYTGYHIERTYLNFGSSRKSDLVSLAYLAGNAFNFKFNLLNEFYFEMDNLSWDGAPDYEKWITRFRLEAQRAVPGYKLSRKVLNRSPTSVAQTPTSSEGSLDQLVKL
jgi:hypothetical protein